MSSDVEVNEEDGKPSPLLYLWLCIPVALLLCIHTTNISFLDCEIGIVA
ncbi:hypothetical protein CAEBREN_08675 [Caenorhabditis brenneri]|uniref:Uncharacterized protein n=1 Tax=Caenorhabditis brenneri TaxID=135651 RepID=G0NZC9_CAEBE|nr:hypothetical protein CAEBREN_08675 [Caenorhabditis brenneri]